MKQSRNHLIVLGLVLALFAAAFYMGYSKAATLGLDLKGGLEVVLEAHPDDPGEEVKQEDLVQSLEIIRDRVDELGVAEPEIRTQEPNQISIALPGITNPEQAVEVLGSTAKLFFYDFEETWVGGTAYRTPYDALKQNQDLFTEKGDEPDAYYLFDTAKNLVVGGAASEEEAYESCTECDGKKPKGYEVLTVDQDHVLLRSTRVTGLPVKEAVGGTYDPDQGIWFVLEDKPGLSGESIDTATPNVGQRGWVTSINFDKEGGKKFGDITEELYQRGALRQQLQSFAIVLDDEIVSTPTIDYKDASLANGIRGGAAEITGLDDQQEAQNLALVLKTGALPLEFDIISQTQVSATLGDQSLKQGVRAGGFGLAIVMIYLILFYRFLGVVADLALMIYAMYFYALIVAIPIVMTLPGIAGMVLTIGVAADANIVIFERIREEYRAGRTARAAISAGYRKGLQTILDANLVTLIAAFVLFLVAAGGVRGFALLLGVGVILSMLTAVAATYAMLGILGNFRIFRHPAVLGTTKRGLLFAINWMRYRTVFLGLSAAVILTSFALIAFDGLNLGIDFRSGTKIDASFEQKVTVEQVRDTLTGVDPTYSDATIQQTQAPAGSEKVGESSFNIQLEKLAGSADEQTREQTAIKRALDDRFSLAQTTEAGQNTDAFNVQTIGPTFGKQVVFTAVVAVIISLLLEVGYIWMRFEFKFAIPVLVAIVHDMALSVGIYALTDREFKTATVAALLTILGYSLYDTIIVFDRIRENTRLLRKSSYSRIVDVSLNEVLMRSINTSISTLLPVGALFLFGGETLKDFAFALLVGIFAGAYSSLTVAAPLLCLLKEREESWKRRKALGDQDADKPGTSVGIGDERAEAPVQVVAPTADGSRRGFKSAGSAGSSPASDAPSAPTVAPGDPGAAPPATSGPRKDKRPRSQRKRGS